MAPSVAPITRQVRMTACSVETLGPLTYCRIGNNTNAVQQANSSHGNSSSSFTSSFTCSPSAISRSRTENRTPAAAFVICFDNPRESIILSATFRSGGIITFGFRSQTDGRNAGKRQAASGKRQAASGKRQAASRKPNTPNPQPRPVVWTYCYLIHRVRGVSNDSCLRYTASTWMWLNVGRSWRGGCTKVAMRASLSAQFDPAGRCEGVCQVICARPGSSGRIGAGRQVAFSDANRELSVLCDRHEKIVGKKRRNSDPVLPPFLQYILWGLRVFGEKRLEAAVRNRDEVRSQKAESGKRKAEGHAGQGRDLAAGGDLRVGGNFPQKFAATPDFSKPPVDFSLLTPRQLEVLRCFVDTPHEPQIARRLKVRDKTVKMHLLNIQKNYRSPAAWN